ncbi:MAG TPA: hypothetical protein VFF13_06720 [archaeon]|nr:hypothetical protein [archaeon]
MDEGKHPLLYSTTLGHKTHAKVFETNSEIPERGKEYLGSIANHQGDGETSHFYVDARRKRRK